MTSEMQPVLIAGQWRASMGQATFFAVNPRTTKPLSEPYPISPWAEVEEAIRAAAEAAEQLRRLAPEQLAAFLERYAERIEGRRAELVSIAEWETALAAEPRLNSVELPRTTDQLRQAAAAARERSWSLPTIDTSKNIRSLLRPAGPVAVFGPNNFPFAFNSMAGGDFAAAIAAGNPVIAKANTSHPGTTRVFAEEALIAARETDMPAATVQLLYRTDHKDGEKLVGHPLLGATAYTGSRHAGLTLKHAADKAGKPIYLELSSINPVVVLPGALKERGKQVAEEFLGSCLMGAGQFCTNPGFVILLEDSSTNAFIKDVSERFRGAPVGTLLGAGVLKSLEESVKALREEGAKLLVGGEPGGGQGFCFQNTILAVTGNRFVQSPEAFQREAFGNVSLFVIAEDLDMLVRILKSLEGNLTGCVYSDGRGSDDAMYDRLEPLLRSRVGRLLNDKMPTGVAVSPAMNHGGPYPATGHGGFTAVGIPTALRRFAMLACYDNVRPERLPPELRDANPTGKTWRCIDGVWTRANVR